MKKIFCFIVLVFLTSCSSFIYNEMERIGIEIINEPDRLLKLEHFYPEYYSDSLMFKDINDTIYLKELRNYIKYEFNKNKSNLDFYKVHADKGYLKIYKKAGYKYELHPDSMYSISICKDNYCIDLTFLKYNGQYYIFDIMKSILNPHPHN